MFGTTSFVFFSTPNCSACLVEATASAPKAMLTNTSAPLLAMLSSAELKSVVPSGTTCWFATVQPNGFTAAVKLSNTEWP